jgi:spore germination protein GerM
MMKKITAIILAALMIAGLCSCKPKPSNSAGDNISKEISLTFMSEKPTSVNDFFVKETRTIKTDDKTPFAYAVIDELYKGPMGKGLKGVFPSGVEITNVVQEDDSVLVSLHVDKYIEDNEMKLMKSAIALTLFDVEGVKKVGVYAGEIERDENKKPIDLIKKEDIKIEELASGPVIYELLLYVPDLKAKALRAASISYEGKPFDRMESIVCSALIKTISDEEAFDGIFNKDVNVLSVKNSNGVCTVDFSASLLKAGLSSTNKKLIVYSFVNSLCELPEVNSVEFLVNGKADKEISALSANGRYEPDVNIVTQDK